MIIKTSALTYILYLCTSILRVVGSELHSILGDSNLLSSKHPSQALETISTPCPFQLHFLLRVPCSAVALPVHLSTGLKSPLRWGSCVPHHQGPLPLSLCVSHTVVPTSKPQPFQGLLESVYVMCQSAQPLFTFYILSSQDCCVLPNRQELIPHSLRVFSVGGVGV